MRLFIVHRTVPHKDIFTFHTCATCDYSLHSPPFSPPSGPLSFLPVPFSQLASLVPSRQLHFLLHTWFYTATSSGNRIAGESIKILLAETGLISSMIVISVFLYFLANSIISFLMIEKKTPLCMYTTFYLPIPVLDPGLVYRLVIETISAITINTCTYM